jgi:predicted alpha/beta superfamily hydrolase
MTSIPLSDGTGRITRHASLEGRTILPRHVDVWLPPGYESTAARYPVIYMHDGQNLFDPALAYGGVDWGVDEAMSQVIRAGRSPGAIIVGVWNSEQRWRDYMPNKPFVAASAADQQRFVAEAGGPPLSDDYLRFLVENVKPLIDRSYRTLPDQPHTFVMGSSMGGLISLYALTEYPEVFGGAGCVSTHWPIGGDPLVDYFGSALPRAGRHRLYFDYGTATLDAGYEPFQRRMDALAQAAGYRDGQDWITRKFEGAEHNEAAWRARVDLPLAFLLRAEPAAL